VNQPYSVRFDALIEARAAAGTFRFDEVSFFIEP